jgi:hypothetical protein
MADMLATVADLATSMQTTVGDPDFDGGAATLALEVATGAVQAVAEQRIVQVVGDSVILDLDWDYCGLYLPLPEGPVTAVASVQVGATTVTDFTTQLRRGRLWRAYGWRSVTLPRWDAPSTVTVVYTHGYPAGDQRLQFARGVVLDVAKARYEALTGGQVVREQIDDYAVQYAAAAAQIDAAGSLAELLRRRYGRTGSGSVRLAKA